MRTDVMLDIETLGTNIDSTVFQIAGCSFDLFTGEIFEEFNELIDLNTAKDINVEGSTLKWWTNEERAELLSSLINSPDVKSDKQVFRNLRNWMKKLNGENNDLHLWGNGIAFDNVMIKAQLEKRSMRYPVHYRNDRDLRTLLDLAIMKSGKSRQEIADMVESKGEKHNAIDDVKFQIGVLAKCMDLLGIVPGDQEKNTLG